MKNNAVVFLTLLCLAAAVKKRREKIAEVDVMKKEDFEDFSKSLKRQNVIQKAIDEAKESGDQEKMFENYKKMFDEEKFRLNIAKKGMIIKKVNTPSNEHYKLIESTLTFIEKMNLGPDVNIGTRYNEVNEMLVRLKKLSIKLMGLTFYNRLLKSAQDTRLKG
uniref:Uncharacterized protein n=1 Tax=Clastoptera arizonana TaxID=38151 RepID=A0A1B6CXS4_9HEMI